ncbi:MAG: hypothetical protein ACHQNA_02740 [Acidimicrobiales bacterium]
MIWARTLAGQVMVCGQELRAGIQLLMPESKMPAPLAGSVQ